MNESHLKKSVIYGKPYERFFILFSSILYAISLTHAYVYYISPVFSYEGYTTVRENLASYIIISALSGIPSLILGNRMRRPSDFMVFCTYYIIYVPTVVISFVGPEMQDSVRWSLVGILLLGVVVISVIRISPSVRIPRPKIPRVVWWVLLWMLCALLISFLIKEFGLRSPPSLVDPYTVRFAARGKGSLVGYALRLCSNVLVPVLIAYGLDRRRYILVLIGAAMTILIYSFDGTKMTLAVPIIVIATYIVINYNIPTVFLVLILSAFVISGSIIQEFSGNFLFHSFFTLRMIIVPGILTTYYYKLFIDINPYAWSQSIFGFLVDRPHDDDPSFLVGKIFFGRDDMSANANFLADGFANLGAGGGLVMAVIFFFVLLVMDGISRGKERIAIAVLSVSALALMNTGLTTTLVTHGLLATLLLIWTLPIGKNRDGHV